MIHRIFLPPIRYDDGATISAVLIASKLDGHAVAILIPTERFAGATYQHFPIIIEEGRLLTQKSRG